LAAHMVRHFVNIKLNEASGLLELKQHSYPLGILQRISKSTRSSQERQKQRVVASAIRPPAAATLCSVRVRYLPPALELACPLFSQATPAFCLNFLRNSFKHSCLVENSFF
jgi:hypothetical protein